MSTKTKIIAGVLGVLVLSLIVFAISFLTAHKTTNPAVEPTDIQAELITSSPKMGRFDLGEFIATLRDEDLHYIKIQVELGYVGALEHELEERKGEMRDKIINILMKLNIQRAKEDFIDRFLHKEIEKELNNVLGKSQSESRIIQINMPVFLIN